MRQIEITTRVNNSLEEINEILRAQGFNFIRTSRIEDKYMKKKDMVINKDNVIDVLKESILIRYLNINNKEEYKKITYKNKVYEKDMVISEEKININIDSIDNAVKLFGIIGYEPLVNVNYDAIVYSNGEIELCFQNVENLGILLEYENENDFTNSSIEEILLVKKNMLNDVKSLGINVSDDLDVKKAYELIYSNL